VRIAVVFLFIGCSYRVGLIGEAAIISTGERGSNDKRGIPPTAVGGLFRPSLQESGAPILVVFVISLPSHREGREGNENGNPSAVGGIREAVDLPV
jgi:hypothetical protein